MTIQHEFGQGEQAFTRRILPWLVAAAALAVYLITLNDWVTISSLPYVARATGRMWTPELSGPYSALGPFGPAHFLVTYPFRFLPVKWVPLALNLFSAVCGTMTLALLARSVALLPHDRTHQQRLREQDPDTLLSAPKNWLPPVVASCLMGLQLSHWSNATVISSDSFNALLFAYVVRCLLEYRISTRDSWLWRGAAVYGAGMTGNWLLILLLPFFLGSMLWIRGFRFFDLRFLRNLVLCGLAGLLLYLLLPSIYMASGRAEMGFWDALKPNVMAELGIVKSICRAPPYLLALLATTSLLPTLLISVRWAAYFGDPSKLGIALTTGMLHIAHAAFLIVCVWVGFEPVFSSHRMGLALPELDFLSALAVGYFTGYFLLVFRPLPVRLGRTAPWQATLNRLAQGSVWLVLAVVTLGLVWNNLPQILVTNGPAVKQYSALLTQNLPSHAVVLCDSESTQADMPKRLWLADLWLTRTGKAQDYVFFDTVAVQSPTFHGLQQKRYPGQWPTTVNPKSPRVVPPAVLLSLLMKLAEDHPVYYLHPSFGYYFEVFYPQPRGLGLELLRYATNTLSAPMLSPDVIKENEAFWKDNQATFNRLLPFLEQNDSKTPSLAQKIKRRLHIPFDPNPTAQTLGRYYSQTLDFLGTEFQKAAQFQKAGNCFTSALALNPQNLAAKANLDCNRQLRANRRVPIPSMDTLTTEFQKYRDWQQVLRENGPFDDPVHCFGQALYFGQSRLLRASVQQFERVHEFDPDSLIPRFWLARFYANRNPEKSLALISEMRTNAQAFPLTGLRVQDLDSLEAIAYYSSHRESEGDTLLQRSIEANSRDEAVLSSLVQVSEMFGRHTNALTAVEYALQLRPTNAVALVVQGYVQLQLGNFREAVAPLTRALALQTNNTAARFDRAVAYLRSDQLDEAKHDYKILEKSYPTSFKISYGLAEIAWRNKDTNTAIHYYQMYLSNAIPDSDESKWVRERLKNLTSTPP